MDTTQVVGQGVYTNVVVRSPFQIEGQNLEVWQSDIMVLALRSSNQYESKKATLQPGTYTIKVLTGSVVIPQVSSTPTCLELRINSNVLDIDVWAPNIPVNITQAPTPFNLSTRTVIGAPTERVDITDVTQCGAVLVCTAYSYYQGIAVEINGSRVATIYGTLGSAILSLHVILSQKSNVSFVSVDDSLTPPPWVFINSGVYYK